MVLQTSSIDLIAITLRQRNIMPWLFCHFRFFSSSNVLRTSTFWVFQFYQLSLRYRHLTPCLRECPLFLWSFVQFSEMELKTCLDIKVTKKQIDKRHGKFRMMGLLRKSTHLTFKSAIFFGFPRTRCSPLI